MNDDPARVWTIGHSTLSQPDFLALLARWSIEAIADVRRHAGSRRFPHFHVDALSRWLPAAGIVYQWIPALGGRRRPRPDSPNRPPVLHDSARAASEPSGETRPKSFCFSCKRGGFPGMRRALRSPANAGGLR